MILLARALHESWHMEHGSEVRVASLVEGIVPVVSEVQRIYEQSLVVAELSQLDLQQGKQLLARISCLSRELLQLAHNKLRGPSGAADRSEIRDLLEASRIEVARSVSCTTGFEWVDGVVVRAAQLGHWLVVDNINLCAASVLDRLNSLLEPGGSLLLTESGEGTVVTPHANFRVFFCMDPSFGEISRAMRNRCVEVAFTADDACNDYSLARSMSASEEMGGSLAPVVRSLCDALDISHQLQLQPAGQHHQLPKHFPRFRLFSRICSLFTLNRQHGMTVARSIQRSIDTVVPGLSSQLLLPPAGIDVVADSRTASFRTYIRELLVASFIPQDIFMVLTLIADEVDSSSCGNGGPAGAADSHLWMDAIVKQAERKSCLEYARHREVVQLISRTTAAAAVDPQGDSHVSVVVWMNRLILLTRHSHHSMHSWLDDVIRSAMEKIGLGEGYLYWLQRYESLQLTVCGNAAASSWAGVDEHRAGLFRRFSVMLLADRCLTLDQERLCAAASRSSFNDLCVRTESDHLQASLSLYTIATGVSEGTFSAESRELNILSQLLKLLATVDELIGTVLRHVSNSTTMPEGLLASIEDCVQHMLLKRDTLSHVLCSTACQMGRLSKQRFPWDDASTCSSWLRKTVQRMSRLLAVTAEEEEGEGEGDDHCVALLEPCANAEAEFNRFERSVCAYWQRPVLQQKLRLWKEGGHAIVPAAPAQAETLFALRRVIVVLADDTARRSFVDAALSKLPPLSGYRSLRSHALLQEWLSLYCTFYWVCTKEDDSLQKPSDVLREGELTSRCSAQRSPKPFVDIASLSTALSGKIAEHLAVQLLLDLDSSAMAEFDSELGISNVDTQYTALVHRQISRERAFAGEQSVGALVELMVVRNMMAIIDSCSTILMRSSRAAAPDMEQLTGLCSRCSLTVRLALRYTTIPPSELRETQTLAWAIDSVLSTPEGAEMRSRMAVLVQLLRVFVVTLEPRIFSMLTYLKCNHPETINYSYHSPTLSLLIYNSSRAVSESIAVPWQRSTCSSVTKLIQPTAADVIFRYIDIESLCARYQGNGKLLKYLTCSTASITVSSIHIARRRMLQLMRIVAQSSSESTGARPSIRRPSQLGVYTLDVLTACRDFYFPGVREQLLGAIAALGHSRELYERVLGLQLHTSISDSSIGQLFEICLPPVLQVLVQELTSAASGATSIAASGRAWLNMGLLRLHLLLPTMPIDPAAKPAIKARLLTESNHTATVNLRSDYLCHAVTESNLLTAEMIRSHSDITGRAADIERLTGRGIVRPSNAASFIELYEEVKSAMDGFLSVSRLQDLLIRMEACSADGIGSTGSRDGRLDGVRVSVQEEQAWQANAASFVDRLHSSFAPYEDITSTVVSAISNISMGLRLVVGCFQQEARSTAGYLGASSTVDADMAVWVDVMRYPFSSSSALHHQSTSIASSLKQDLLHPVKCLLGGLEQLVELATDSLGVLQSQSQSQSVRAGSSLSADQYLPEAKSVGAMTPHIILLHALSRIEYLVQGRSISLSDVYSSFQAALTKFVEAYLKGLDEKRRLDAEQESLYRHRSTERVFESNEAKEEEAALKLHFPQHLEDEFRALPGVLKEPEEFIGAPAVVNTSRVNDDDDDEVPLGQQANDVASDDRRLVALWDTFDQGSTSEVVGHHARLTFSALSEQLREHSKAWVYSPLAEQESKAALDHHEARPSDLIATKYRLQHCLCEDTLVTAKALNWALNGVIAPAMDDSIRGASLMALAMMVQMCPADSPASKTTALTNKGAMKKAPWRGKATPASKHTIDRDLLLLLNADSDVDRPIDFHKDANPAESSKASVLLQAIFDRASELLTQFPGNELLLQVCRVSAKISEFHLSTSIGKMLISLQLLLQKAEEWELFAAKHVSLREEMNRLGGLISEWRELELKSWATLLRSKEISHARKAQTHWYTLMRILQSQPIISADDYEQIAQDPHEPLHPWPALDQFSPPWLRAGYRTPHDKFKAAAPEVSEHMKWKMEMMDQEVRLGMTGSEYLSKVFSTVESFLSQSTVGEFPTRLHLIRLFGLQLQLEHQMLYDDEQPMKESKSRGKGKRKAKQAAELKGRLANIVGGLWQYFEQFLPVVRKFQDLLREPIQGRLKGEVKMGKWDQLNTYALIEYSDKIHRKLNKFLREYESDVLDYPISAIIRKEVMEDFVNKAGELQPAYTVPSTKMMFPALLLLNDESAVDADSDCQVLRIAPSTAMDVSEDMHIAMFSDQLPRVAKLDFYTHKMRKYLEKALNSTALIESQHASSSTAHRSACYGWLAAMLSEGLCTDAFNRIESLQSEDTSKPMKQRAVRDLLQTLKEHGISHLRSTVSEEVRHNMELFCINAPLGCEVMADLGWSSHQPRNLFERGEVYFAKNLLEVTQLRGQARAGYSSDVSPRDSAVMVSLAENMLVQATRLRCAIGASLEEFKLFFQALYGAEDSCCSASSGCQQDPPPLSSLLDIKTDLRMTEWANNVMLDNLIQLQCVVSAAAQAHEASNVEEDSALVVLPLAEIGRVTDTLRAVIDQLARISVQAESDGLAGRRRSVNAALGLDCGRIGTIKLHTSRHDGLDVVKAAELLSRYCQSINTAWQLFSDPILLRGMSALASADVVSAVHGRFRELQHLAADSQATLNRVSPVGGQASESKAAAPSDLVLRFGGLVSSCIDDCLISVQKIRGITDLSSAAAVSLKGCFGEPLKSSCPDSGASEEDRISEGSDPLISVPLQDCIALSISALAACQLRKIADHLSQLSEYRVRHDEELTAVERHSLASLLQRLKPVCLLVASSFSSLFEGIVSEYKSFGKLLYVCLRIFRTLLAKGICSAQQSDGGDDDQGPNDLSGMVFQDDVEGTGMGEGEGKKDVSDQIENEEQLLGLKDDKPKDGEAKKPQDKKTLKDEQKDSGVEMEQDFEGDMYDMPEDEDDGDDESGEEEDEDEPEKELGDADMNDIVDEKQWDADEDSLGDDGADEQEKEQFEKDSKMKGEALEDEMRTRNDEGEGGDQEVCHNPSSHACTSSMTRF